MDSDEETRLLSEQLMGIDSTDGDTRTIIE